MTTRQMTQAALLTALICIIGPVTLPLGPVPLSLTTGVLMLTAFLLGKQAVLCCGLYLLMGLCGLPVFSGFTGGISVLAGPTGGYLLGYLPMAALSGWVCARTDKPLLQLPGFLAGTALLYLMGTAWYCWQSGTSAGAALAICVLPFLPGDAAKITAVLLLGPMLRRKLKWGRGPSLPL